MKKTFKIVIIIFFIIVIFNIVNLYIKSNIDKKYETAINNYLKDLASWHESEVKNKGTVIINITLGDLVDRGYSTITLNPKTKKPFDKNMKFCIINDNGEYKYYQNDGNNCGKTNIKYINTPKTIQNDYLYSQILNIDFPDLEGLEYFIKSSRVASSNTNINYYCRKGIRPSSCREVSSTKNIEADKWYKVSGDILITYDEHSDEEGILYALVKDNLGYENIITITLNKIDRVAPIVVLDSPVTSTNSISIKIKDIIDNETGIASSLCRYGTTIDNYTTMSMSNKWGKLSKCSINYILKDKVYYYQICATDNVGNVGCSNGSSLIKSIKNPKIDRDMKITFNTKKNKSFTYYIKSDSEITIDTNTISYCGKDILPRDCINSGVRKLIPNVWYQVENIITIKSISDKYTNIYALTYSNDEYIAYMSAFLKKN